MINSFSFQGPVLVLAPHPDDEIGCGGMIARLIEQGYEVHHYYFSDCEESNKALGHDTSQLIEECNASRRVLGIPSENWGCFDFRVRYFPEQRQEILESLIKLRSKLRPGLVLAPNKSDIHQDHSTIAMEAIRAFKHCSILGYELPWNMLESSHDCLVKLDKKHLDVKLASLACYKSQGSRHYANHKFFESLACIRGVQAQTEYAECYEVIRMVY
ncbi:PIG-L deacetylase family protein [Delftia acidovorans]|uniref:PIG-L family deacetylase n=2 Tax=Delftia lacustris TaxID=558537 RepID=A0A7T3DEQ3_9BURK|nr:PIG-L deacetylase family protein [Delftia acidovorans]QPS80715.1 PIG-L family deacetylase [Delftia lacustris]